MENLIPTLTNGECLELITTQRNHIEGHIKQMRKQKETTLVHMIEKVNLLQAYDALIDKYKEYLSHN